MNKGVFFKLCLALVALAGCGALMGQQLEEERGETSAAPQSGRIIFGSNFVADPCSSCDYNTEPSGYAVWGPDNCTLPGEVQSVAVPFIAIADGVPRQVLTSIILNNPAACPSNKVTLGLYTDTCGEGPGTLLATGEATVAEAACGQTMAKLRHAPTLNRGVKYWITATTSAAQSALDSRWYASNDAGYAFNLGSGWQRANGIKPAFSIQGTGVTVLGSAPEAPRAAFGGNLFVDPCNGCNYDSDEGGFRCARTR